MDVQVAVAIIGTLGIAVTTIGTIWAANINAGVAQLRRELDEAKRQLNEAHEEIAELRAENTELRAVMRAKGLDTPPRRRHTSGT